MALRERVSIITGGPGTGKSTTLRIILDRADADPGLAAAVPKRRPCIDCDGSGCDTCTWQDSWGGSDYGDAPTRYELAASTGKAARRMMETTSRPARTVHRLLEYSPRAGGFQRNADNPINTGLVVIDETSMLDVELAHALFGAIDDNRTRLVLIGDSDQLPSVGPGRVFGDLVDSGEVPVARLTTLHRAAATSWICRNAPRVLAGELPELRDGADFQWHSAPDRLDAASRIVSLVTAELPGKGIHGAQVLVPQNPGPAGVDALNQSLQAHLNPLRKSELAWGKAPRELRVRDRVIQTKNDYELGVMNGEVGVVREISRERISVDFDGRDPVGYDRGRAEHLALAYALTTHRAQGSEWPWVVVLCHSTHSFMLSRSLLYTALTRAKVGVVLVGDKPGLERAVANVQPTKRNTSLIERLRGVLPQ